MYQYKHKHPLKKTIKMQNKDTSTQRENLQAHGSTEDYINKRNKLRILKYIPAKTQISAHKDQNKGNAFRSRTHTQKQTPQLKVSTKDQKWIRKYRPE